jgi:hypothetical protein
MMGETEPLHRFHKDLRKKGVSISCKVDYNGTSTSACIRMKSTNDDYIEMRKSQVNK